MKNKKGNFLTIVFSFLPGAGHMYMGFMKMGVSFMSAFFFIIFLSTWLNISPLLYSIPVVWFYSFFDCINKQFSSEEQFESLEDGYMFSINKFLKLDQGLFKKRRLLLGIIVILIGIYLIWNNIKYVMLEYIGQYAYDFINAIASVTPQVTIGIIIIAAGIKLIIGKKKELDMDHE